MRARRNINRTSVSLFIIGLLSLAYFQATIGQVEGSPEEYENIPHDMQLIAELGIELPMGEERLVIWPTSEYTETHHAREDISERIPPVYPEGMSAENAKPIKVGGMAPEAALEEAGLWIREILLPHWIPSDLPERLIPLREEAAEWSKVLCRYQVEGNAIQIAQTRWGVCVVLRPEDEGGIHEPESIPERIFPRFFTKGEEMSALRGERLITPSEDVVLFELDEMDLSGPEPLDTWWGWTFWYTDGHAVAVFLQKRLAGGQYSLTPSDPWF